MTIEEMREVLALVEYRGWRLLVLDEVQPYLQLRWLAPEGPQSSRKWRLSAHMTKSELVQTAFKAIITAEEHEAREAFRYRGVPVFGPHYDVDALAEICTARVDVRSDPLLKVLR